jgi:predicted ArsR family transcriptional regulator
LSNGAVKTTPDQILFLLKTRGPATTGCLADSLGITRQASRKHMENLATLKLVSFEIRKSGPGRPHRLWSLTETGHARFPDSHAQMTVDILEAVRSEFGEAGLDRLISRRERETTTVYRAALAKASTLAERVKHLAALRTAEGYMAEYKANADGSFLLIENHCPICAAATACRNLCRSELATFREALGENCSVERIDHIFSGARRCAYRIA